MQTQEQASLRRKITALRATAITVVVLLLLGFLSGWISLGADRQEELNRYDLRLSLNTDEIRETAVWLGLAAQHAKETAQTLAEMDTIEGTLSEVDEETQQLTIDTIENKQVIVKLDRSAKITREGKEVTFSDLQPDQLVMVYYKERDKENWAGSIRILTDRKNS